MAKILLSLDERLVRRIDAAARRLGLTRSAYMSQLAEQQLGRARGPGSHPRARQAIAAIQRLFAEQNTPKADWAEVIRDMRDARSASARRR